MDILPDHIYSYSFLINGSIDLFSYESNLKESQQAQSCVNCVTLKYLVSSTKTFYLVYVIEACVYSSEIHSEHLPTHTLNVVFLHNTFYSLKSMLSKQ